MVLLALYRFYHTFIQSSRCVTPIPRFPTFPKLLDGLSPLSFHPPLPGTSSRRRSRIWSARSRRRRDRWIVVARTAPARRDLTTIRAIATRDRPRVGPEIAAHLALPRFSVAVVVPEALVRAPLDVVEAAVVDGVADSRDGVSGYGSGLAKSSG